MPHSPYKGLSSKSLYHARWERLAQPQGRAVLGHCHSPPPHLLLEGSEGRWHRGDFQMVPGCSTPGGGELCRELWSPVRDGGWVCRQPLIWTEGLEGPREGGRTLWGAGGSGLSCTAPLPCRRIWTQSGLFLSSLSLASQLGGRSKLGTTTPLPLRDLESLRG